MAGHSKWANIKHRKAAQDAKRGKVFTKLIRELVVAAKAGGPNVEDNPRLRTAVDKALGSNMKRDTVDKAIARGVGAGEGDNYDEITYEGYAPGGVAVLVECMTDNRNRTVSDVRHGLTKRGGNLGTDGSVAYLFRRIGQFSYEPGVDEVGLMDAALEAGAEEVNWEEFLSIKDALTASGFKPIHAEIVMAADIAVTLDKSSAEKLLGLVDALEDLDDVQNVYTNADIPEDVLMQIGD